MVCIDFTASNGAPQSPSSLHYANPSNYMQGLFNQCVNRAEISGVDTKRRSA